MLEAGCDGLRQAGYEPFYFESILDRDLYFAGSVERRARELEDMFVRDDICAIVCARGGYARTTCRRRSIQTKSFRIPKFWWATATSRRWSAALPTRRTSLPFTVRWWQRILPFPTASI